MARDGYQAYINKAAQWIIFTASMSTVAFWLHLSRKRPTFMSFMVFFTFFFLCAAYGAIEYSKLYIYLSATHADNAAAKLSSQHCAGGVEYYTKMLRRNRLFRYVMDNGQDFFTKTGDCVGATTSYLVRFGVLQDMKAEQAELGPAAEWDDF